MILDSTFTVTIWDILIIAFACLGIATILGERYGDWKTYYIFGCLGIGFLVMALVRLAPQMLEIIINN